MFDAMERGLYWLSSMFVDNDAGLNCKLRAPVDNHTWVTTQDDLLSVIVLKGARKMMGDREFELATSRLNEKLSVYMKVGTGRQHQFGFAFVSDPESSLPTIRELMTPSLNTARRYGGEGVERLFEDMAQSVALHTTDEFALLLVMTCARGLTPDEQKRMLKWKMERYPKLSKEVGGKIDDSFSQSPRIGSPLLYPRHQGLLENLLKDISNESVGINILADLCTTHQSAAYIRKFFDKSGFSLKWKPRLLGDAHQPAPAVRKGDASHLFPIQVGRQIITEPINEHFGDAEMVFYNGTWMVPLVMDIPPEAAETDSFASLADRIGRRIPWSVNFEFIPNGLDQRKVDQLFASFFGAFGDHNKAVKSAVDYLKASKAQGEYIVALRATFMTWAKTQEEATNRLSFLKLAVQGWGSSVVSNETGAPAITVMSGAPGFAKRSYAPYMPGPISSFTRMMPFTRPTSVWPKGAMMLRTKEGKPFLYELGTPLQLFWGMVIFAPTGGGKSFLMNTINRSILFGAGVTELPYIVLIDVGMSGTGVINLAKAYLPKELADQCISIRIRNSREYCINPFDTMLGCEEPTPNEKDFMVAVLAAVCANLGDEGDKFLSMVIDAAFLRYGRGRPDAKRYQRTMEPEIARAVDELGIEVDAKTSFWEIEDALFDRGEIALASKAHRYVVPVLSDLIEVAREPGIANIWSTAKTPSGESIIEVFSRSMISAAGDYELISRETQYDIGNARIVMVDLEEVVGSSKSEEGRKRSALMYLFARQLGAKNFFVKWDEVRSVVPKKYMDFHQRRVNSLFESLKVLEYDEAHNAAGVPALQRLIQKDLREGRKYKTVTIMASQMIDDFPKVAVENSYTYFILGSGSTEAVRGPGGLGDRFGLSETEMNCIERDLTGPTSEGAPLFAMFKTTRGVISQLLYNTVSSIEAWAYTTTVDDVRVRDIIYKRIGVRQTLEFLAEKHPRGLRLLIEDEKNKMGWAKAEESEGLYETIATRVLKGYKDPYKIV